MTASNLNGCSQARATSTIKAPARRTQGGPITNWLYPAPAIFSDSQLPAQTMELNARKTMPTEPSTKPSGTGAAVDSRNSKAPYSRVNGFRRADSQSRSSNAQLATS